MLYRAGHAEMNFNFNLIITFFTTVHVRPELAIYPPTTVFKRCLNLATIFVKFYNERGLGCFRRVAGKHRSTFG